MRIGGEAPQPLILDRSEICVLHLLTFLEGNLGGWSLFLKLAGKKNYLQTLASKYFININCLIRQAVFDLH